jgi:hypothetical protein
MNIIKPILNASLTVALGLSLAVMTAPASAAKKGPQASVSVATTCSLDGTDFTVNVAVRDKTSGDAVAEVSAWDITAVHRDRGEPGNTSYTFGSASAGSLTEGVPFTVSRTFSLCDGVELRNDLNEARALNAEVSVTYGPPSRTVNNRCSDDPTTEEVEPAGINLSPADLDAINYLCMLQ